jgi:hypothetical protein
MAFDKLIDALNEFRGEYVRELTNSLTEKNLISSGQLGESIKLNVQPKVKLFGQIYRMQIRMANMARMWIKDAHQVKACQLEFLKSG